MFTYTHELRRLHGSGEKPEFPAVVEFAIEFEPTIPFGVGSGVSRTVYDASPEYKYDHCTGRFWIETEAPGPVRARASWEQVQLRFDGPVLRTVMRVGDEATLMGMLTALHSYLPVTLGMRLREPISVSSVTLRIAGTTFDYQACRSPGVLVNETDLDTQRQSVVSAVDDLTALYALQDHGRMRPALAAMRYLNAAQRLQGLGASPREFFGEALLNYAKVLEALWGADRDDIRAGLNNLGVSEAEIEAVYIPVCLLRNSLDVGHAALSLPPQNLLNRIYEHLEQFDMYFFRLMERVLDAVRDGRAPYRCIDHGSKDWRELERVLDSLDNGPEFDSGGRPFAHYRMATSEAG